MTHDQSGMGCGGYLLTGLAAMLACGYFVTKVVGFFSEPDDEIWAVQMGMLAGIDAMGIAAFAYGRSVETEATRNWVPLPVAVFSFGAIGMKCAHGYGLAWLFGIGAINALVGLAAWLVTPRKSFHESASEQPCHPK